MTHTIFPDNATNITVYDAAGRVAHAIDARGATNAFGYDAAGRRTYVTNAWGTPLQQVMSSKYDANGNLTNMVDALGRATDYEYDLLNRRVKTIFPATVSGGTRAYTLTGYDTLGRRVSETNEAGVVSRFGYDSLGRLIAATNAWNTADATWATYAYDEAGHQTNQVDALNRATKYEYDALGRRIRRTLPGNQSETFGYDTAGNLLAHTNFNGLVITNQYDSMNRLVKKAAGSAVLETYVYDTAGRLTNRTDASGSWRWVYDNRDRLKTNTGPAGSLYYKYDVAGNLTNLLSSTANGVSTVYQYDPLNRLTNVVDPRVTGTKNTAYAYDGVGNLAALKYPNGVTNLWQYDTRSRLTNEVWKLNATTLASFYYELGLAGNRTNLQETLPSATRAYAWSYDQSYRLTNEVVTGTLPTGTLGYNYDGVGNQTNRNGSLGNLGGASYTYNTNDWLTSDSYDNNGNTTNSASVAYKYDYANRLTNANNGAVVILYDAEGNRVSKKAGSTTTLYLIDTRNLTGYAQVLEELTVSGGTTNLSRQYTYGLDLISQRQNGGIIHFYCYDGHGSVRLLTDGTEDSPTFGLGTDIYTYDAYGTLIAESHPLGVTPNNYLYAGEQWDNDLGLYYLRARYLKPNTGRFWTRDSYEGSQSDPLSLHKYLYAHADPIDNSDPSGYLIVGSNFIYGNKVHREIGAHFVLSGIGRYYGQPVSTILGIPWTPGFSASQPDLVQIPQVGAPGSVYEIKPAGSYLSGATQLTYYLGLLNGLDPLRRTWIPGGPGTYAPPSVINLGTGAFAMVSPPVAGVILYQVVDLKQAAVAIAAYGAAQLQLQLSMLALRPALAY